MRRPWIPHFNIQYYLGLDGISLSLVVLTGLVSVLACLASWNIEKQVKGYFALYLLLVASMMGVFISLDLFLFYVFFEVMLLPMYFLIGIWGGAEARVRRDQVPALHAVRLGLHPGGDPDPLLLRRATRAVPGFTAHSFDIVQLTRIATETELLRPQRSSAGSSCSSSSASSSSCRRSRSTPGCPTRTSRRRRRSA